MRTLTRHRRTSMLFCVSGSSAGMRGSLQFLALGLLGLFSLFSVLRPAWGPRSRRFWCVGIDFRSIFDNFGLPEGARAPFWTSSGIQDQKRTKKEQPKKKCSAFRAPFGLPWRPFGGPVAPKLQQKADPEPPRTTLATRLRKRREKTWFQDSLKP